jgi:hypothetical protein
MELLRLPVPTLQLQDPRPVRLADNQGVFVVNRCPERVAQGKEYAGFLVEVPDLYYGGHKPLTGIFLEVDCYRLTRGARGPYRLEAHMTLPVEHRPCVGAFAMHLESFELAQDRALEWLRVAVPLMQEALSSGGQAKALAFRRLHWMPSYAAAAA